MPFLKGQLCRDCAARRRHVSDLPASGRLCEHEATRVCDLIDASTVYRHSGKAFRQLVLIADQNDTGFLVARMQNRPWPRSADAFLTTLRDWHKAIFDEGEPDIAGTFRTEPVHFDKHEGAAPRKIKGALRELHDEIHHCVVNVSSNDELIRCAARFFEAYLWIHPFVDGNGRTARLAVGSMLRERALDFDERGTEGNEQKRYLVAVENAHRYNPKHKKHQDSLRVFGKLTAWIRSRVISVPTDATEVPPDGVT